MKNFLRLLCLVAIVVSTQSLSDDNEEVKAVLDSLREDDGDVEIVGLGDSCGEKSVCDHKSHLVCHKAECVCDKEGKWVLDGSGKECVTMEGMTFDEDEGSPEANESEDKEGHDEDYEKEEENSKSVEENQDDEKKNETSNGVDAEPWVEDEESGPWDFKEEEGNNETNSEEKTLYEPQESEEDKPVVEENKKTTVIAVALPENNEKEEEESSDKEEKNTQILRVDEKEVEKTEVQYNDAEEDDEAEWVLPKEGEDEEEKADPTLHEPCDSDHDCTGRLAYCRPESSTCECLDRDPSSNRTAVEVEGRCYVWRTISSPCVGHSDCDKVIQGPSWCHDDEALGTSYCTCKPFHVWDEEGSECVPLATQGAGSPCRVDDQCSAYEALGPLSFCSPVTGLCQCMTPLGLGAKRVLSYQDKCVEERTYGDFCQSDQECQASLGPFGLCDTFNTCSCLSGQFCTKLWIRPTIGGSSGFTSMVLLILVVALALGTVMYLFVRRRADSAKHYYIIQSRGGGGSLEV